MPTPQWLQYITRVYRVVYPRERRIENHSMRACWEENDWEMPSKYLPSVPNVPAGYKAFWRYDKPEVPIPPYASRMSMAWTQRHFQQFMGGARVLPMSIVRREMDSTTSCGYPWNLTYQNKDQMYQDPKMEKVIGDYSALIRENFPCGILPIWTCSVKGREMRTVEKIKANNLRTFTAAPVEHSAATNELCLDMNDRFYRSAGKTWSQVGSTKFDGQWHAMHHRLKKHRNAAALDGKQFDASLLAQLLWDQMWIRFEMLEPQYRTIQNLLAFMNIYDAIISSVVVMDAGDLIRKFLGNPSGSSNTVVDNTMVLFRFMCLAWIILAEKLRKPYMQARKNVSKGVADPDYLGPDSDLDDYGYETFISNVEAALYGDDDTFSVSDFVREWFTPRSIAEVWTSLGLTTTADNWEYAELETLSFLSQTFVCVAGLWMPSPETEKVLGSLYLGSSVDDIRFHLLRAYALRIESWANPECRMKIEVYINFVHQYYSNQLVGIVRDIPMSGIRQVWKTDRQIMRLYSGEESTSEDDWRWYRASLPSLQEKHLGLEDPAWRLVGVELNPGPELSNDLNMHISFKCLSFVYFCLLPVCVYRLQRLKMTKQKKKVKKAAKKEAVKEVKKILRKKGPRRARRAANVLHGKGGYWGDLGKQLGGHIGGVADSVVGIGKALTGRGAYHTRSNSLMESGGPPSIVNSKYTSIVRHREYICDITGSTGFAISQYPINPGCINTFPWLAGSAEGYEQYRVRGMIFEFHSTSATAVGSTNTALGTVIMATEYNSNLPAFTNKLQMENHEYATTTCPDHSAIHPIECARGRTVLDELYVRSTISATGGTTVYPASYNPLLYDLGQFYIATYGMQAASVIGELWVSYEIEFLKPALSPATVSGTAVHYYYDSTLGSAPTSGNWFVNLRNKNTGVATAAAASSLSGLPLGRFVWIITGIQASTNSNVPAATITGGSSINIFSTVAATGVSTNSFVGDPRSVGAATTFTWMFAFEITSATNSISLGAATVGAISVYDMYILPYPGGYSYAESRKAVDWDPVAVLSRRLIELENRLESLHEDKEEEKYCDSQCSTPLHVEPDLTQSTQDLATSLLSRLRIGDRAVTQKTAYMSAA